MRYFIYFLMGWLLCPVFVDAQIQLESPRVGESITVNTNSGKKKMGVWTQKADRVRNGFFSKSRPVSGDIPAEDVNVKIANIATKRPLAGGCLDQKEFIYWKGELNDSWDESNNWLPQRIPANACDIVVLENSADWDNSPSLSNSEVTIGGLVMHDGELNLSNVKLAILDTFFVETSIIHNSGGNSTIDVLDAVDPHLDASSISNIGLSIVDFTGGATITLNTIGGNFIISDGGSRDGEVHIFGNYVDGHLTIQKNGSGGEFYFANGNGVQDVITRNLNIEGNTGNMSVGSGDGEPLVVYGSISVMRHTNQSVSFDKITIAGDNFQLFEAPIPPPEVGWGDLIILGTPLQINKLFFRKDWMRLVLGSPLEINELLHMGPDQAILYSYEDNMLTLNSGAIVVDEDPVNGSFVQGPMEKIGNQAFTFPLGATVGVPIRPGTSDPVPTPGARPMMLYGDFKAPLSISAPTGNQSGFIAEYLHENPTYHGYDIQSTDANVSDIMKDAFWKFTRSRGNADVAVSLTYNEDHYEDQFDVAKLQIAGWDGDKWIAHGTSGVSGDNSKGTVTTGAPLNTFGPLAFYQKGIRQPQITILELDNKEICINEWHMIHFSLDTAALEGTIFRVELSDENGDFDTNPPVVGSKVTNESDSIEFKIPSDVVIDGNYKLRIIGDKQFITSTNTVEVIPKTIPQTAVVINGADEICVGAEMKYYITGGAPEYEYEWTVLNASYRTEKDTIWVTFQSYGNREISVKPINQCGIGPQSTKSVVVNRVIQDIGKITGPELLCPGQPMVYRVPKHNGVVYEWRLSDGSILDSDADTAAITFAASGSYKIYASATGMCGPINNIDSMEVTVLDGSLEPLPVTNMLPSDGTEDLKFPFMLSWVPGADTRTYDVYVWETDSSRPELPIAKDLSRMSYTINRALGLEYGKTYNWQVVSNAGCQVVDGPVQTFQPRKPVDLAVTQIDVPATANAGQTITINWTIKNNGPGATLLDETWNDAVYLSFDTIPFFQIAAVNSIGWSHLDFPVAPLLVGTRSNVSALDVGEEYQNSIDFALPRSYSQPMYAYIVTSYKSSRTAPFQINYSNDTARSAEPIVIVSPPTPDLRVDTVVAPSTIFSGSTVNVTYKVTNFGAVTPSGSEWQDGLYISKSTLFDKETATKLKLPKPNETYYPAVDARYNIAKSLLPDSSYTKSVEVVIPNFINGTWYLHVVANDDAQLYEGPLINNNENNHPIQITLTPTPQLSISSLTVPVDEISPTQSVGITWNVKNLGFHDNLEKNKGFYSTKVGTCNRPCDGSGSGQSGCSIELRRERDSLSWGSSYWVDKLYLSTNPNMLNTSTAILIGEAPKGTEGIGFTVPDNVVSGNIHCLGSGGAADHPHISTATLSNVLRPGSNHPNDFIFEVPSDLPEGEYYLYVQTNSTNTVYTYVDTPVVRRSGKITLSYPDLMVTSINVPAQITGGTPYEIDYIVTNNGPGSIYSAVRKDALYMSDRPTFDSTAVKIHEVEQKGSIPSGESVSHTMEGVLPDHYSGAKYFFIRTNDNEDFIERSFSNNASTSQMVSLSTAPPVDLVVIDIQVVDTAVAPGVVHLSYTLANIGDNPAMGKIVDSIFISCSPDFERRNAVGVARREGGINVEQGETTNQTISFNLKNTAYQINDCFEREDFSTVYYHIVTNDDHAIYEGGDTINNVFTSSAKKFQNYSADIMVSYFEAADTGSVGRPLSVEWKMKNIGLATSEGRGKATVNRVYFSKDSVWNEEGILALIPDNKVRLHNMYPGDSTISSAEVVIPKLETGEYYVYVVADADVTIRNEVHRENNIGFLRDEQGRAKRIYIEQSLLPDFVTDIIDAPEAIPLGQPVTITYRVTNIGEGDAFPLDWKDIGYLATENNLSHGSKVYNTGTFGRRTGLAAGESYEGEVTIRLSLDFTPGNYFLLISSDYNNDVVEMDEENNLNGFPIEIYIPAPADLIVENIVAPDTVYLGYPIDSIQWNVVNQSINPAKGISTDAVYISKNQVFDSTARLLGIKNKQIDMAPVETDTVSIKPLLDAVPEGMYYLIVRADVKNNIPELDKGNNESVSAKPIYVSVRELELDVTIADTMTHSKYYKLLVPDSLLGSTIQLTLRSEDSTTVQNELYVGGGYVPSVLKSDYKFGTTGYGNQEILLADVFDSVYYISARSVTPNAPLQQITVHATVLPFSILKSETDRGGNIGNVTVKLTGSLFTEDMTAKLTNGTTDIPASLVYFVNSTTAYVTFPLMGSSIGTYDIVLNKPDESEAVLPSGFSVVSPDNGGLYTGGGVNSGMVGQGTDPGCDPGVPAGLNSQLVAELVVPDMLGDGWDFMIQIHYNNPTNMDIPTQTRVLYNDLNLPMSLNKGALSEGKSSIYVEIKEADGPPGVIRAGGSGTITIHSTVPLGTAAREGVGLGRTGMIRGAYVNFTLN